MPLDFAEFGLIETGSTLSKSPGMKEILDKMEMTEEEEAYCMDAPTWSAGRFGVYIARQLAVPLSSLRFKVGLYTNCGAANVLVWQPVQLLTECDEAPEHGEAYKLFDRYMLHVDNSTRGGSPPTVCQTRCGVTLAHGDSGPSTFP